MSAFERRKESKCPFCSTVCEQVYITYASGSSYFFQCNLCNLDFVNRYTDRNDDDDMLVQIDTICPECKKHHRPGILGQLRTTRIPCEDCWDKACATI